MIRNTLSLMIVCAIGACTPTPSSSQEQVQSEADEIAASNAIAMSVATPAMIAAARTGDPDAMAASITLTSCVAPFMCNESLFSCGNWSSPVFCDAQCTTKLCVAGEGNFENDISSSFRVCWDALGQNSCTEWRQTIIKSCGC
jgi:hypothetical protein